MTFLVSHAAVWAVLGVATVAGAILLITEWRRPNARRRPARLGATVLALAALAIWPLRPALRGERREATNGQITADLWTSGTTAAATVPEDVEPRYRFALPGANVPPHAGATFLPDAATLLRRFPQVGRLRVHGDGLEPADLPALAGLHVEFVRRPGPADLTGGPSILSLRCPRGLALGETLVLEGRAGNLPEGKTAALTLEAPDGTVTEAVTDAADARGGAPFVVRAASPAAAGKSLWRLRFKGSAFDETLGVEVRAPTLPRVLVLESAPRFDTALLRRWYEDAGGQLRARVRLGQDRYRFFAAAGAAPGEFNALDAALLAGCDLVLADARALAALPAPEREILRAAVIDTGLGVLTLADDAILPPAVAAPDRAWLFPWQLRPLEAAAADVAGTEHTARIVGPGLGPAPDVPLPVAPAEIVPQPGQRGVIHDAQGRALAALAPCGRGTLALSLVRETGRWQRANDAQAFAGYWSFLFGQIARRLPSSDRWTLVGGDHGPVFVDRPLACVWTGESPGEIRVSDESGAAPVTLAPASAPMEPDRWRVTFWPRRAGWHRLESARARLDFYVHPAGSWLELAAERRREATERFAATSTAGPDVAIPRPASEPTPIPAGWWFGAFLLAAGFLWTERRLAGA